MARTFNFLGKSTRDILETGMLRRYEPDIQQSDYRLARRVDSFNINANFDSRKFLSRGNAPHVGSVRVVPSDDGRCRVYGEQDHWEGEE